VRRQAALASARQIGVSAGQVDYQTLAADYSDVSMVTDVDGVFQYVAPNSRRLLGWDATDLEGRSRSFFVHPSDGPSLISVQGRLAAGSVVTVTYRFRRRDGSYVWIEDKARPVHSQGASLVVSTLRELDDRDRSRVDGLTTLLDPLTGLANRSLLMDRLAHGVRRLDYAPGVLAVITVDLDRFNRVNSSLGHSFGDGLLVSTADRLRGFMTPGDTLARLGGDEFVLLAEGLDSREAAIRMCQSIVDAFRLPIPVGTESHVGSVSVGMTATVDPRYGAEELIREASLALYRAKERGRDRAEVFDDELRVRAVGRVGTERMLRDAIAEHRIVVEYQPIVDIASGQVVAAEALLRVKDAQAALLTPGSFLDVAAETGLLLAMDRLVLTDAVTQAAGWHTRLGSRGFGGVSINVSTHQLEDQGFAPSIIRLLERHEVPARVLHLEMTEHTLMASSAVVRSALNELRTAGAKLGLDDFGTGYSSLSYLSDFQVDFVKIDQSFVKEVDTSRERAAIVSAIIGLSHDLGLSVTAEGVETQEQLSLLESLDCDRAQGFLFARSGAPHMVDALVFSGSEVLIRNAGWRSAS
jgi:diguanylate cyclase (GGDEF)-like protein/PAS domain S-box-containing protein